jgi:hypothetical protein
MAVFIVAYDLRKPGKDYGELIRQLESVPSCHAQGSVWFIEHSGPSNVIRDTLRYHIDSNDVLFVDRVTSDWGGVNMPVCGKWLNDHGL